MFFSLHISQLCNPRHLIRHANPIIKSHALVVLLQQLVEVHSVIRVRQTGPVAASTAAATGDGHKAVDAEGDQSEDEEENYDDDGDDVVFLHFVCVGERSLRVIRMLDSCALEVRGGAGSDEARRWT